MLLFYHNSGRYTIVEILERQILYVHTILYATKFESGKVKYRIIINKVSFEHFCNAYSIV